jgi:hypothetical protein
VTCRVAWVCQSCEVPEAVLRAITTAERGMVSPEAPPRGECILVESRSSPEGILHPPL